MARRPPIAVERAQALRPALRVRLPRVSARRLWAGLGAVVAAVGLAYLVARETPLFALRDVSVTGAPPEVAAEVRAALRPLEGTSLVKVDAGAVERSLAALPAVIGASVDRAFPHGLVVAVQPDRPVAIVRSKSSRWVVSAGGVVIRPWSDDSGVHLPRIVLDGGATALSSGRTITDAHAREALAALERLPSGFPVHVRRATAQDGTVTLWLWSGAEIRLGAPARLDMKLAAAAAVLDALTASERDALAYMDVTLPSRPVVSLYSQVEG